MEKSVLSFNASTTDRVELSKVSSPYQILPGGRGVLQTTTVDSFISVSNPNILIHASYITRPFKEEISPTTLVNLKSYVKLAHRLGTQDILIHMPSNVAEYENYSYGLSTIIKYVISNDCICHLETNPFSKELRSYLSIDRSNAYEKYVEYTDKLFSLIPQKYASSFMLCVDTAHLFANGCKTSDMVNYIKRYESRVKYIHFNGNKNGILTKDLHVPMYRVENRIDDVDTLATYCSSLHKILIAEDSTEKGDYDEWHHFCDRFGIELVPFSEVFSI